MSFANPLSTLKIIVNLGLAHLGIPDLPATHPAMDSLKTYFRLNALTAQMADQFNSMPKISRLRENSDAMLGKLRMIASDPNLAKSDGPEAQKKYGELSTQYKGLTDKVTELLEKLNTSQEQYNQLVETEHEKIAELLERIQNAGPNAMAISGGKEIGRMFAEMEARRAGIEKNVKSLREEIDTNYKQLSTFFDKTRTAIPSPLRPPVPPEHESPRQEI